MVNEFSVGGDWEYVFNYTKGYKTTDVAQVIAALNGYNDGECWVGIFLMNDGVFLYVTAWCDFTGWGCQEGGTCNTASTLQEIINMSCTQDDRIRLGLPLNPDGNTVTLDLTHLTDEDLENELKRRRDG